MSAQQDQQNTNQPNIPGFPGFPGFMVPFTLGFHPRRERTHAGNQANNSNSNNASHDQPSNNNIDGAPNQPSNNNSDGAPNQPSNNNSDGAPNQPSNNNSGGAPNQPSNNNINGEPPDVFHFLITVMPSPNAEENNQPSTPFMVFFAPLFIPPQEVQKPHLSDAAMNKLPLVTITQEHINTKATCSICLERFSLPEITDDQTQRPIREMP
ncbi:15629_t:CDS:1, partial [Cetraspora pellucida]